MSKKPTCIKPMTTHEEYMASLSPEEVADFHKGYQELVLSELFLAIMKNDVVSVRELAREAGISPTIIRSLSR